VACSGTAVALFIQYVESVVVDRTICMKSVGRIRLIAFLLLYSSYYLKSDLKFRRLEVILLCVCLPVETNTPSD
jgi:hypothetical protein